MRTPKLTKKSFLTILLYVGFIVFLFTTNPNKLPIGLLLLPIAWLFLCLFVAARFLFSRLLKNSKLSRSRRNTLALLAAGLPSLLLLLKSIDQLTARDSLLLLLLIGFALFYASRINFAKRNE
jgi:uncharacterized membrane protein YccC